MEHFLTSVTKDRAKVEYKEVLLFEIKFKQKGDPIKQVFRNIEVVQRIIGQLEHGNCEIKDAQEIYNFLK